MLKIAGSPNKPATNRNDGSKLAFNRNNNSKLASGRNNGDGKGDGFSVDRNGVEYTKKSGKLLKSGKSKSEKTFNS